ncbi:MAG: hypothetical protein GY822_10470 [Deltaproteobacteria bacterium]|nr:hypothetical protein [Deltaproteobacteria bacterium]
MSGIYLATGNNSIAVSPSRNAPKNTLIISSIGGNDLKGIADQATAAPQVPDAELWLRADQVVWVGVLFDHARASPASQSGSRA